MSGPRDAQPGDPPDGGLRRPEGVDGPQGPEPLYDDRQVALILKRAAELQHRDPAAEAGGSGLSLAELEQIALEAGIDPRHVRQAALDLHQHAPRHPVSPWLGAPLRIELERSVPGQLPESQFGVLVEEIRREMDQVGNVSSLGGVLESNLADAAGRRSTSIQVKPQRDATRIRIEQSLSSDAGGIFGALVGGIGTLVMAITFGLVLARFKSPVLATVVAVMWIAACYGVARGLFQATARRRDRKLRKLLDRLAEQVSRGAVPPEQPSGPGPRPDRALGSGPGNLTPEDPHG